MRVSPDAGLSDHCACRAAEAEGPPLVLLRHRRRCLLAVIAAVVCAQQGHGPTGPNRKGPDFCWKTHLERLDSSEFRKRYRLSPESFYELLGRLWHRLVRPTTNKTGKKAGGKARILPHVMLAVTLRYFAGGDVLDLKLIYHLRSTKSVYACIWRTVDAINMVFKSDFPIDDLDFLRKKEAEFAAASSAPTAWRGQVGAVDGVHFETLSPGKKVKDPLRHRVERKNKYAILAIAVSDAHRRISYFDISQLPTTHDALAWHASALGVRERAGELPYPYFFNGDAAFAASSSMIVPSGGLDDNFDFYQSSNRMCVECAFGVCIRRFPLLWRPIQVRLDRRAPLIGAIFHMHNFCIDQRLEEEQVVSDSLVEIQPSRYRISPHFDKDGRPVHYLTPPNKDGQEDGTRSHHRPREVAANTMRRDELRAALHEAGLVRPTAALQGMPRKQKGKRKHKAKK